MRTLVPPGALEVHVAWSCPSARACNQVRDYLDVAALSDRAGIAHAADVLTHIDDYYADQRGAESAGVATQLARQLADPRPADTRTIKQLDQYKELDPRWTDWKNVTYTCRSVAVEMVQ
jgi:hypothetical protein